MEFIEVEDADAENVDVELGTLRRVQVNVYWRHEQTKVFDVPADMTLNEVRESCVGLAENSHDENFNFADSELHEFECWLISDMNTDEEWWI
jgi:hypothetical protein